MRDYREKVKGRLKEDGLKVSQKSSRGKRYYEIRSIKGNTYVSSIRADSYKDLDTKISKGDVKFESQKARSKRLGKPQYTVSYDVKEKSASKALKAGKGKLAYLTERWYFSKDSGKSSFKEAYTGGTSSYRELNNRSQYNEAKKEVYKQALAQAGFSPDNERLLESRIVRSSLRSQRGRFILAS